MAKVVSEIETLTQYEITCVRDKDIWKVGPVHELLQLPGKQRCGCTTCILTWT